MNEQEKLFEQIEKFANENDLRVSFTQYSDGTPLAEFEYWSDLGEDVIFNVETGENFKEFAENLKKYADGFDIDEHVKPLIGVYGGPSIQDVIDRLKEDEEYDFDNFDDLTERVLEEFGGNLGPGVPSDIEGLLEDAAEIKNTLKEFSVNAGNFAAELEREEKELTYEELLEQLNQKLDEAKTLTERIAAAKELKEFKDLNRENAKPLEKQDRKIETQQKNDDER